MFCHDLFQSPVIIFEGFEAFHVADCHTGVFGFPNVVGRLAHPVLAAKIGKFCPGLGFLEHANDLFFGVLLALHSKVSPPVRRKYGISMYYISPLWQVILTPGAV